MLPNKRAELIDLRVLRDGLFSVSTSPSICSKAELTMPRASRNDLRRLCDHVEVALLNASSYINAALSVALAYWFEALVVAAPSLPEASSPRMRARCCRTRARISLSLVPWGTVSQRTVRPTHTKAEWEREMHDGYDVPVMPFSSQNFLSCDSDQVSIMELVRSA